MSTLHPDRLLPVSEPARSLARGLYEEIAGLPIVSPHGHTDASWFAENRNFSDATSLFLTPDHYVLRMLRSQGISYEALGLAPRGEAPQAGGLETWTLFAANYHPFAGTPSRLRIDDACEHRLSRGSAGDIARHLAHGAARDACRLP